MTDFWQIFGENIFPVIFLRFCTSQNWNDQIWIKIEQNISHYFSKFLKSLIVLWGCIVHWLIFFFPLWQQLHQPWPHWYRISEWISQVINVHRWLGGRGFFRRIRSSQILSNTLGAGMILWGWFITGVFNMLNAENGPKTNDKSFYKTSQELRNCPI